MRKIRIMIADDQRMWRQVLLRELNTDTIEVIGMAENGRELIELVKGSLPDIVVLDLGMPIMDGHEVLEIFETDFPLIRTVVLSMDYTEYLAARAIMHGAAAYLQKESDMEELIRAIEQVYDQGHYFNEIISEEILNQFNKERKIYYLMGNKRFSQREIDVLKQLCTDLTPGQIADKLNITESTVRFHRKNLLEKTESDTSISLLKYAVRQQIIKIDRK